MNVPSFKRPSVFLPLVMSLTALAIVLGHAAKYGVGHEPDKGTATHVIFQLLMVVQVPIVVVFAIEWLPQARKKTLQVLALQAGAALVAFAAVFFAFSGNRKLATNWLQWLDLPLKELAILLGGCWVLMNYFRGRTHKALLQLRVVAERASREKDEFLILKTELNNVGQSKVELNHDGCAVTIFVQQPFERSESVWELSWKRLKTLRLYQDQQFVEPNGLLIDTHVVLLPALASNFLRVQARFESTTMVLRSFAVVAPLDLTGLMKVTTTDEAKTKS